MERLSDNDWISEGFFSSQMAGIVSVLLFKTPSSGASFGRSVYHICMRTDVLDAHSLG
jgi:hypothetical protein